jgi:hypothetical protein
MRNQRRSHSQQPINRAPIVDPQPNESTSLVSTNNLPKFYYSKQPLDTHQQVQTHHLHEPHRSNGHLRSVTEQHLAQTVLLLHHRDPRHTPVQYLIIPKYLHTSSTRPQSLFIQNNDFTHYFEAYCLTQPIQDPAEVHLRLNQLIQ